MFNNPLTIIGGLFFGSLIITGDLWLFHQLTKPKSGYFEVEEKHKANQRVMKVAGFLIFALAAFWVFSLSAGKTHNTPQHKTEKSAITAPAPKTTKSHTQKKSKNHTDKKSQHSLKHK